VEFVRISKAASRLARGNRLNNKYFLKTRLPQAKVIFNQNQGVKCLRVRVCFLCTCVKMNKEKAQASFPGSYLFSSID